MKSCGTFVLLANMFISFSNADICITASGSSTNQLVFGNYIQVSDTDNNGNIYYIKENFCETLYLNQISDNWRVYTQLDSNTGYIWCQQDNLVSPADCTSWTNGQSGVDPSISASRTACPGLPTPSLSCGAIEIDMDGGNWFTDGVYEKIDENLYKYTYQPQSIDYYFQFYIKGEYYVIARNDSRTSCSNTGPRANIRTYDRQIDTIQVGNTLTVTSLDHPTDRTVTFTCLDSAPTPAPTTAAPTELCFAVTYDTSSRTVPARNVADLASIAGKYSSISDPNGVGYPAYQLSNDCGTNSYIVYVPKYQRYMILSDLNNPDSYSLFCDITTDFNACQWNPSYVDEFTLVDNAGNSVCDCGMEVPQSA